MSLQLIKNKINAGQIHPVYFLSGEETWSIDVLTDLLMEKVLTDAERDFNQHVFYSKDTNIQDVLNTARRYPVFAERQLILVREAQHYKINELELMLPYIKEPVPTTTLVFCYMHGSIKLNTIVGKAFKKHTEFYRSVKLKDYKVPDWIKEYAAERGKSIDPKTAMLILDHVGNDLSKISNEMDKLLLNIPATAKKISAQHIEDYIGISKEFNAFELSAALANRDFPKAMRIIHYFGQNPKAGPMIFVLTILFNYFSKVFQLHLNKGLSDSDAAKLIRVNPYFFKDYKAGLKHYNLAKTEKIIEYIAEYDARGKGIGSTNAVNSYELMKEMIFKIMM